MADQTRTRHLIRLPGRAGGPPRYYWQPNTPLRALGWRPERLPDDPDQAKRRAEVLNAEVDAWRRGELPANAPAAAAARARQQAVAIAPGSVSALIRDYKASRFWAVLSDRTKIDYGKHLDVIEAWAGPEPVLAITPPVVQAFYAAQLRRTVPGKVPLPDAQAEPAGAEWMPIARFAALRGLTRDAVNKAIKAGSLAVPHKRAEGDGRGSILVLADPGVVAAQAAAPRVVQRTAHAAAVVRVLRLLLKAGIRLGYIPSGINAAASPGLISARKREPQLWSPEEVQHMAATADALGWRSIGTAILLNEWIGQREEDVLALRPWRLEAESLRLQQGKTKRRVILPVYLVPRLVDRLKREQERAGVVSTEHLLPREGTEAPWSEDAFRHAFAQIRARAAATLPSCRGLWFAELRHTAVTRLHEAGADELGISGITGHSPKTVRDILDRHYLVRTEKAAVLTFRKRLAAEEVEGG